MTKLNTHSFNAASADLFGQSMKIAARVDTEDLRSESQKACSDFKLEHYKND